MYGLAAALGQQQDRTQWAHRLPHNHSDRIRWSWPDGGYATINWLCNGRQKRHGVGTHWDHPNPVIPLETQRSTDKGCMRNR